ncbi:hypothetical protein [Mycetocola zhujimingii]|uniref:hypothetical protein n=1 Tax=Mycetocola zhujimingii TaxID=2079792 RepID=UPI000D358F11|nr:hypothetical protein [Mycetocola zhujimingii]AWB85681.1 hypothetical protein C3E77_02945 [Mycetocola zhujimingii]
MSDNTGDLGPDSTIPDHKTGLAAGYTGEPSSFEPEEDPEHHSDDTDADPDAGADAAAGIQTGDKRIES